MTDLDPLREQALEHIGNRLGTHWESCEGAHWRCCMKALLDRLSASELARDEAYATAAIVCDQRRPIVPVTETEWRVHKALGEAAERIRALQAKE